MLNIQKRRFNTGKIDGKQPLKQHRVSCMAALSGRIEQAALENAVARERQTLFGCDYRAEALNAALTSVADTVKFGSTSYYPTSVQQWRACTFYATVSFEFVNQTSTWKVCLSLRDDAATLSEPSRPFQWMPSVAMVEPHEASRPTPFEQLWRIFHPHASAADTEAAQTRLRVVLRDALVQRTEAELSPLKADGVSLDTSLFVVRDFEIASGVSVDPRAFVSTLGDFAKELQGNRRCPLDYDKELPRPVWNETDRMEFAAATCPLLARTQWPLLYKEHGLHCALEDLGDVSKCTLRP